MGEPTEVKLKEGGLSLSFPFIKRDEKKREVWGYATTEDKDSQGEIVGYEASVKAFDTWTERFNKATAGHSIGNVREMHGPTAIGKLIAYHPDPANKGIWVGAKLSRTPDGDSAWQKIEEGILTGFSIGAPTAERSFVNVSDSNVPVSKVTSYELAELSIVDNPSCPGSFLQEIKLAKAASGSPVMHNQEILESFEGLKPTNLADTYTATTDNLPVVKKSASIEPNAFLDGNGQVWKMSGSLVKTDAPSETNKESQAMESPEEKAKRLAAEAKTEADKMTEAQKAGKTIGPQQQSTGKTPGEQVPKVETPGAPEEPPTIAGKAKKMGNEDKNHGRPGGPHAIAVKPSPEPDGQGDAGEEAKTDSKQASAEAMPPAPQPGSNPMEEEEAHSDTPPGSGAPMGKPRFGYCAMCGEKFANGETEGAPMHDACDENQKMMDKTHAPALEPEEVAAGKSAAAGMSKAFGNAIDPLVKTINAGFATMEKRIQALEKSDAPGGPVRTELPTSLSAVEKGAAASGPETDVEKAMEKSIGAIDDPFLRDRLSRELSKSLIKRAQAR